MNQILFGLKREYWEHKRLLLTLPIIVTTLFCLVAIVATWQHHFSDSGVSISIHPDGESVDLHVSVDNEDVILIDKDSNDSSSDDLATEETQASEHEPSSQEDEFWFIGIYLGVAWLAALFYAQSTLFNDRRDKSILYWKTMPVSELQTVLSKYLFAIFGFSFVAIGVGLITSVILMGYAQFVFPPEMLAEDTAGMRPNKLLLWPILAVLSAVLWCAPVFALFLFVSAWSKKMPLLMLLVIVIVIRLIERILFSSDHVFDFISMHSPFYLLGVISESESSAEFLSFFFVESFLSLVLGLLIAAVLIWRTAWYRDHRFEL